MKHRFVKALANGITLAIASLLTTANHSTAAVLHNGWQFAIDPNSDSLASGNGLGGVVAGGTVYEIHGMAVFDDVDTNSIWVALNANLPITGNTVPLRDNGFLVPDGNIGWGDLVFDFSGSNNIKEANGSLLAVRFADSNDSFAPSAGIYNNVSLASVASQNAGWWNLFYNNSNVVARGQPPARMGDLAWNDSYFTPYTQATFRQQGTQMPNVIQSGTKIGDITLLNNTELISAGFDVDFLPSKGSQTFGFKFTRPEGFVGGFIATLMTECVNDGIALAGNFASPPPPPPPPPSPSTCTITPGQFNPLLPTQTDGDLKVFDNAVSGAWYDPPATMGYQYNVVSPSLFTAIQGFPCGVDPDDTFSVSVGGITLGNFKPGQELVFTNYAAQLGALLIGNSGVTEFKITDITPGSTQEPLAFPVKISFNTPKADFTIEPVPEPSSILGTVAIGFVSIAARLLRKRKIGAGDTTYKT